MALASALLVPSLAFATTQSPEFQDPAFDASAAWPAVEARFHAECERAKVVGAAIAAMHGHTLLGQAAHGFADLETQRPADLDTIWHWASCTKTLTGIAAMQLRDDGKCSLDDPIVDYVPELAVVHNPFGPVRAITIRHLLTHSGGFRSPTWPWGGDKPWHPHEPKEWSQLVAMLPYTEVEFAPGSKFSYSNPGIVFVGRAIERLSGDAWETYIDKELLKPLGMHCSYFDRTPRHLRARRANNYTMTPQGPIAQGLDFDTGITVSNGGLNAPANDMLKYLAFLLGEAESGTGVLSRASLEEMWQPVLTIAEGREAIGLTFFVMTRDGEKFYGHTGGQKAFVTFFYVHPGSGTAGLGAFNTSTAGPAMVAIREAMITTLSLPLARR